MGGTEECVELRGFGVELRDFGAEKEWPFCVELRGSLFLYLKNFHQNDIFSDEGVEIFGCPILGCHI